jgi:hypothetical protein
MCSVISHSHYVHGEQPHSPKRIERRTTTANLRNKNQRTYYFIVRPKPSRATSNPNRQKHHQKQTTERRRRSHTSFWSAWNHGYDEGRPQRTWKLDGRERPREEERWSESRSWCTDAKRRSPGQAAALRTSPRCSMRMNDWYISSNLFSYIHFTSPP